MFLILVIIIVVSLIIMAFCTPPSDNKDTTKKEKTATAKSGNSKADNKNKKTSMNLHYQDQVRLKKEYSEELSIEAKQKWFLIYLYGNTFVIKETSIIRKQVQFVQKQQAL